MANVRRRDEPNAAVREAAAGRGRFTVVLPGKRTDDDSNAVIFDTAVLPAAGAYASSTPLDVKLTRTVHLYITLTHAAATNRVSLIPEMSWEGGGASGEWYPLGVTDGAPAMRDLGSAPDSSYSVNNFNGLTFSPLEIQTAASDGTETTRMVVAVDVTAARWFRLKVAEFGDTANPTTLTVKALKSV